MIETNHPTLSIRHQCDLIGLNRSTFYWQPASETSLNLALMQLIDQEYTRAPFYGYRKMTVRLNHTHGYQVNHKRVARLMAKMGLRAIYPQPRTTISTQQHKKYPYLLRGLDINRPNQVWAADITYVPMSQGFMYLVAVMDWFSRFVVAWQLSNTLDGAFCLATLRQALQQGQPEIFNTDQGVQFTAHDFTHELETSNIRISMDGRGRYLDNIFVERLWRTVAGFNISSPLSWGGPFQTLMIIVSGLIIFGMLALIVRTLRVLAASRMKAYLTRSIGHSGPVGIVVGMIVTVMVQSSSITTSVLVPLAAAGMITLPQVFPITLGANVGTTITAILASMAAPAATAHLAVQIAMVHLLFNLSGIVLIYPIERIRRIPLAMAEWLAGVAVRSKRNAVLFVLGVFYGLPALLVFVSRYI